MSESINWYRFVYVVLASGPTEKIRTVNVYRRALSAADALVCEQINHGFSSPAAIIALNYVSSAPAQDDIRENEIVRDWSIGPRHPKEE